MAIFDFQRRNEALDLTSPLPDQVPVPRPAVRPGLPPRPASILSMGPTRMPVTDMRASQAGASASPDTRPDSRPALQQARPRSSGPADAAQPRAQRPEVSRVEPSLHASPAPAVAKAPPPVRASAGSAPQSIGIFSPAETFADGLAKLPFLQSLRAAYPDARISWITTGSSAFSDQLRPLTKGLLDSVKAETGIGASRFSIFERVPFNDHYSILIDTQRRVWRSRRARRINHDLFISSAGDFQLSGRRPAGKWEFPAHVADRLSELMKLATGEALPEQGVSLAMPSDVEYHAASALPEGPAYLGLAPGGPWRPAVWPLGRYVELARRQVRLGRVPVFLLGQQEESWEPILRSAVPQALFPQQNKAAGGHQYSPFHTIALAGRLHLAVSNDGGIGHLLAAGGAPVISLFGPSDPARSAPRSPRGMVLDARAFGRPVIEEIPIEAVMEAIDRVLAG
ncbi:MAG: glycosyltransferase family 9 protein [Parvibaculaceae bacterium]|nr:glycosyltransferase family 9 protein [Parvibaculaceae bacterium]